MVCPQATHLQVVTGGDALSHATAKPERVVSPREQSNGSSTVFLDNVSSFKLYTFKSRARFGVQSAIILSTLPIVGDNSGVTRNEETSYDPKGSIEKKNTTEERRNTTLDKKTGADQGSLVFMHTAPSNHRT